MQDHDSGAPAPNTTRNAPALFFRFVAVVCLAHTAFQTYQYLNTQTMDSAPLSVLANVTFLLMAVCMTFVVFINNKGWLQLANVAPLFSLGMLMAVQWGGV